MVHNVSLSAPLKLDSKFEKEIDSETFSKGCCVAQRIRPPPGGSSRAARLPWCPRSAAGVQRSAHPHPPGCCSPARRAYAPTLQPNPPLSNKLQPGVSFQDLSPYKTACRRPMRNLISYVHRACPGVPSSLHPGTGQKSLLLAPELIAQF